jgi:large subunit ribosomal protein L31
VKPGIHPTWYPDAVVTCTCGNTWTTGSTKKEIHTDVCNKCHPFFTGEQRIVDTAGQVERFMKRIGAKEQIAATQVTAEDKKSKRDKRRERKTAPPAPATPTITAPAELPVATIVEKPAAVETPAPKVEAPQPVAPVELPKAEVKPEPVARVAPPAPVELPKAEVKPEPVARVEPPAPVELPQAEVKP